MTPHALAATNDDRHLTAMARELDWLSQAIDARLKTFFAGEDDVAPPPPPELDPEAAYGGVVAELRLDTDARLALALALAPHVKPELLDPFLVRNSSLDRPFTEFGGRTPAHGGGFAPTGQTAAFLAAGGDPAARVRARNLFSPDHPLRTSGMIRLASAGQDSAAGGPLNGPMNGFLDLAPEHVAWLSAGEVARPDFSSDFPAKLLQSRLAWDDLVLPADVHDQIEQIAAWLTHESRIVDDWGLRRRLAPGYRVLFHGPPGTGKTLTAALLGQRTGLDVYRIDLSMVVSKYIGETEKNLAGVFDRAAHKRWILFFDEADALFGARTGTSSANDRHANQEVAYLLQRIEDCPCVTILATNLRGNIDDAFARRFQSLVGFRRPDAGQRLKLWRDVLSGGTPLASDVDLDRLAEQHELTGGAIANAVRHAAVLALRRGRDRVGHGDLLAGVAGEMRKEGRTP